MTIKAEKEYLVCYDYGVGGLWWWITAASPKEITDRYPDVVIVEEVPNWMNAPGATDSAAPHR